MSQQNIESDTKKNYRTVVWCPICSSTELKKLITEKARANGISFFLICKDLGLRYGLFKHYWWRSANPGSVRGFRATELKKIAEVLGIEFKVVISTKSIDISTVKPYIKNKINNKRHVRVTREEKNTTKKKF